MADLKYEVRTIRKEEIPQALDVWRETGMHQGTFSLYTWFEVDPEGLQVAVLESGEVIGVCSATLYRDDFLFVGIYSVRKKYRGLGVGFKVWSACMEHVGSKNAALNAVPGKKELYRDKGGFPIVEDEWVTLYKETKQSSHPETLCDQVPDGVDILPFQESLLPAILEYDYTVVGYKRDLAIELSCKEQDSHTVVAFKGCSCVGFGTIRLSCQECGLVGPLYADDAEVAEVMLKKLILLFPQVQGLGIMTMSNNESSNELARKVGCVTTAECPRLYRKEKLKGVDASKVFAEFDLNFSPF